MASEIKLDNIALDIDPDTYVMLDGKRRGSVHRLVDGRTVFQDRGFSASDMTIQVSGVILSIVTLRALVAIYRKTGYTFTLQDFKGNKLVVCFTPGETSFVVTPIKGSNIGYQFQIQLSVVSVTEWLGDDAGLPTSG